MIEINKGTHIGVIGLGNMGLPMAEGLLRSGLIDQGQLHLSNRDSQITAERIRRLGIRDDGLVAENNDVLLRLSDIVIVALKQDQMIEELRRWQANRTLREDQIIVSCVAGMLMETIKEGIGNVRQPVVRAMPNLGVKFGRGTIGWTTSNEIQIDQQNYFHQLFSSLCSNTIYVSDENLINVITAHSGGGPAYICEFAEAKVADAIQRGISREDAELSERENIIVTARLLETGLTLEEIRTSVCSKKGTTLAALGSLATNNHEGIISEAMTAAIKRGEEIGNYYKNL